MYRWVYVYLLLWGSPKAKLKCDAMLSTPYRCSVVSVLLMTLRLILSGILKQHTKAIYEKGTRHWYILNKGGKRFAALSKDGGSCYRVPVSELVKKQTLFVLFPSLSLPLSPPAAVAFFLCFPPQFPLTHLTSSLGTWDIVTHDILYNVKLVIIYGWGQSQEITVKVLGSWIFNYLRTRMRYDITHSQMRNVNYVST